MEKILRKVTNATIYASLASILCRELREGPLLPPPPSALVFLPIPSRNEVRHPIYYESLLAVIRRAFFAYRGPYCLDLVGRLYQPPVGSCRQDTMSSLLQTSV